MFAKLRVRSISGWTILIFGALAFVLGFIGILFPEATLMMLGFASVPRADRAAGDYTLVFLTAASMASFNVGIYYVLAALYNVKRFFVWTVPFRMVTFIMFTSSVLVGLAPGGFFGVALWELFGALATGSALYFERRRAAASKLVRNESALK